MKRVLDFIGATLCLTWPTDSTNPWVCVIGYESWGVSAADHGNTTNIRSNDAFAHMSTELAPEASL